MDLDRALDKLKSDKRTLQELEAASGIPYETLRDIKNGTTKSPGYETLKRIARFYAQARAA